MSPSWLADECRQQAILFLAAEHLAAIRKPAATASGCPKPLLLEPESVLEREVSGGLATIAAAGGVALKSIVTWVNRLFHEVAEQVDSGLRSSPRSLNALVLWWLKAGRSLAAVDPQQREALARAMQKGGEPAHPAIWCADRFDRFALSVTNFEELYCSKHADGSKEPEPTPIDCRKRLFLWVMSPERQRRGVAIGKDLCAWLSQMQAEMKGIGDDATALFGAAFRIRTGGEVSLQSIDKWVPRWVDPQVGERILNEIRRPVICRTKDGSEAAIAKGMVMLQRASTLVTEFTGTSVKTEDQGGNIPALVRAAAFAASCWQPGEFVSTPWGKAGEEGAGRLALNTVEPALLAVGRWLATAQVVADVDGPAALKERRGELIEAIRISLALEGFQVREVRGGAPANRLIPHASGVPDSLATYEFVRDAVGFRAPLGSLDEPATCPARLFAAIEAVDWRLWAFGAAPWDPADEIEARIKDVLQPKVLRSDEWEVIKRQALQARGERADEETLAKLFTFATQRRLALELLRAKARREKPFTMLDGLIAECGELARESLAVLLAIDKATLSRLDPPRLPDGAIDVPTWLAGGGPAVPRATQPAIPYQLRWRTSSRPRGELIGEHRVGAVIEVVISAGDAAGAELTLLNGPALGPFVANRSSRHDGEDLPGGLAELLARFKAGLAFPDGSDPQSSATEALAGLRRCLSGESSSAFHELVTRWHAGDAAAAEWCRILRTEVPFEFSCFPEVDPESGALQPSAADEEYLAWEFDPAVPLGQDLSVRFAMTPGAARRLISLGPRHAGSVADRTESLVTACRQAGGAFVQLAEEVRRATCRWLTFGSTVAHPIAAARPLLDGLLQGDGGEAARRNAIFEAAAEWCASLDHVLMPSGWRADGRLSPTAFADLTLAPEFDDQALTGSVAIRRFGVRGVHGWPFSGAVSAGPAPAGFREFRGSVEALGISQDVGHTPPAGDLLRRADELPKHALAGTMPLALPNLFDRVWELIGSEGDSGRRVELEAVASRLFEVLKAVCRMIPFEPAKVGEYPAGWIREADGAQPRGRRIKRVVRPGLRTVENVLVRPALVITE